MAEVFQAIVNWLVVGGVIGLIIGLRKIVLMERKILNIEENMSKLLEHIDREEMKIEKKLKIKNVPFKVKK
jgi:hypothetical protein